MQTWASILAICIAAGLKVVTDITIVVTTKIRLKWLFWFCLLIALLPLIGAVTCAIELYFYTADTSNRVEKEVVALGAFSTILGHIALVRLLLALGNSSRADARIGGVPFPDRYRWYRLHKCNPSRDWDCWCNSSGFRCAWFCFHSVYQRLCRYIARLRQLPGISPSEFCTVFHTSEFGILHPQVLEALGLLDYQCSIHYSSCTTFAI
jgi:hypothetical protein